MKNRFFDIASSHATSPSSWGRTWIAIVLIALFCPALRADGPATKPAPFEKQIVAFEQADREHPPAQHAVLFIGSSSITKWKSLSADFPEVTVINRGFGGSIISDSTRNVSRIVIPYHPRKIFIYAGDNDLAAKHSPETVLADFKAFVAAVRAGLPEVPIYYISIKPSPAREKLLETARQANALIADYAKTTPHLQYVDVFTPMLGSDGKARPELFGKDRLHMVKAGYEIWIGILTPLVK